jgi:molybdate transport system ATP-binding protein
MHAVDVDVHVSVADGHRRFDAHIAFASNAPITALYGPSGAGKSLTLQAMAGLLRPKAGRITLAGQAVFDSGQRLDVPTRHRRVGYLFQHYALFPHLNVWDNVAFGLGTWRHRPSAAQRAMVDDLLQRFGLQALARSRPATLSGGQQQRVALARALACKPTVLLLDEPFAALNPMLRGELREELARVVRHWQVPTVMITHDLDDVLALAQVAVRVEAGQVVRLVDVTRGEPLAPERKAPPAHPHAAAVRALLQDN